ncbi:hypothetical protein F4554_003902 [Actinopolymorpha rutila]|uniref:Uncharacterized protein n=1 Tax=Actinopolymorpha rutila TaxID=446787 RepID=A0A852ZED2_9ACTN|nr:hypothetical protein [Actinopolymorpha rutila]
MVFHQSSLIAGHLRSAHRTDYGPYRPGKYGLGSPPGLGPRETVQHVTLLLVALLAIALLAGAAAGA